MNSRRDESISVWWREISFGGGSAIALGGVFSFFLLHLALGYYDAAVEGDLVIGAGRRYGGVESLRLFS